MAFAKTFDTPDHGQVLLKRDANDDGRPELRWYAEPPAFGVCNIAVVFADSDEGWDAAEAGFNRMAMADAIKAADTIFEQVGISQ